MAKWRNARKRGFTRTLPQPRSHSPAPPRKRGEEGEERCAMGSVWQRAGGFVRVGERRLDPGGRAFGAFIRTLFLRRRGRG